MLSFSMLSYRQQMLDMFKTLISHKSLKGEREPNMPFGREIQKTLLYVLDEAQRMDLDSINLGGYCGYAHYGSGSETLAILAHLDVVPAGEGWETDPFSAVIKDGKIYGRGTVDNKIAAVASLFALHAIKQNGIRLKKHVRIIFGCDEESGWDDIRYYEQAEGKPDYVVAPDASFPIINREKGLLHLEIKREIDKIGPNLTVAKLSAGSRPNIVPNLATCLLRAPFESVEKMAALFNETSPAKLSCEETKEGVLITSQGVAAHGAHPEQGVNAAAYLVSFLNLLPLKSNATQSFLYQLARTVGNEVDGASLGIACRDELLGALSCNLGVLKMDEASVWATLDIRYPLCQTADAILSAVRTAFPGCTVTQTHGMPPHYVPENSLLVTSLKQAYRECFGAEAECLGCSGATYARAFGNGVAFGPVPQSRPSLEHGPNEYVEVEDLLKLSEVLARAIVLICNGEE